ncbi:hypothetical protein ABBQ38_005164 [Trebouxia sp. C0009 RCD-2024]
MADKHLDTVQQLAYQPRVLQNKPSKLCLMQVVLLRPGGLGEGAPDRPPTRTSSDATTQGMWCQLTAPDASSGQSSIIIWPLYTIHNALPAPVRWRLDKTLLVNSSSSSGTSLHADGSQQTGRATQTLGEHEEGVLQPGSATPLAVAMDLPQALSFTLMPQQHPQPSGTLDAHTWSGPLVTRKPGSDCRFQDSLLQPTQTDALVPDSGMWQALDIPTSQSSSLSCILVAQPGLHQAPPVCLCLVPHAVLHNGLPFEVSLTCPGAEGEIHIQAGVSQALDWGHLQYRPKRVALAVTESSSGVRLQSHTFALDGNNDSQLMLSSSARPGASASDRVSTFHAAVRVQNDPFEIRAGPGGVGGGVTMDVTHISTTPGCFVSNLTQHHISLKLQGQQHQAAALLQPSTSVQKAQGPLQQPQLLSSRPPQPQSPQHQLPQLEQQQQQQQQPPWHLTCAPSQTNPILNAWRYPLLTPPRQPKAPLAPATSCLAVTVQLEPSAPGPTPSKPTESRQHDSHTTSLHAVDVPLLGSNHVPAEASYQQAPIALMQPSGRTHLLLPDPHADPRADPQDQPLLIAYRCILSRGRLHLVFFSDPQPPCVLHNAAPDTVLVVWCSLQRDKQGVLHQLESEEWISVPAGGAVDCSPGSSLPLGLQGAQQYDVVVGLAPWLYPFDVALVDLRLQVKEPNSVQLDDCRMCTSNQRALARSGLLSSHRGLHLTCNCVKQGKPCHE